MLEPLKTPLHAEHLALGAKMVEFAGWSMPVQYEGVIKESKAVRNGAGMFDVSHMGRTRHRGAHAASFLDRVTSNAVLKLEDGASQYSLLCYPHGGVVDDIIVYRIREDEFFVVINAVNREKDLEWMAEQNDGSVAIEDETFDSAMIAVQGPSAVESVQRLASAPVANVPRFHSTTCEVAGVSAFLGRTGYTGEDGFEIIVSADGASHVWRALLGEGVVPCGLAARDVLRVEAGLPLYGHELTDKINPIEAGLGWVCKKDRPFIGSEPIAKMRADGPPRKLMGIRMQSRIVPREGYKVLRDGQEIGVVSSGVFSPMLDCGIAFAFLRADAAAADQPCDVLIRDKTHPAIVVPKRFMQS
ncbi:MAG: glycine cleavage system protein T [Armatimonadota bacterium]